MLLQAMAGLGLLSFVSFEEIRSVDGCANSIGAAYDLFGRLGKAEDSLAFLLRQDEPDVAWVSDAITQAEKLIDEGERRVETLVSNCGGGVLDWAAELRGALGDLQGYVGIGRPVLPKTDPRHPIWEQQRELDKSRVAAQAELARIRARQMLGDSATGREFGYGRP